MRAMLATLLDSKRNLAIAGGAAVLLAIVLALALGGGGQKSKPKAVASATESKKEQPATEPDKKPEETQPADPVEQPTADKAAAEEPAVADGSGAGSDAPVEPDGAGSDAAATDSTGSATTAAAAPVTPKAPGTKPVAATGSKKTLGGKQLVLEYDAQATAAAKPAPTAPKNDQAAILKARASYAQGNQRLLAGDWNGAVLKYRQSLANYPGYVAGYRGLGLAFMQMGDKPKALQAFRLYISSVPGAKDAPLIKKRIAQLQN
jgi:hypothetical protein